VPGTQKCAQSGLKKVNADALQGRSCSNAQFFGRLFFLFMFKMSIAAGHDAGFFAPAPV
jgi:hypothetical protein